MFLDTSTGRNPAVTCLLGFLKLKHHGFHRAYTVLIIFSFTCLLGFYTQILANLQSHKIRKSYFVICNKNALQLTVGSSAGQITMESLAYYLLNSDTQKFLIIYFLLYLLINQTRFCIVLRPTRWSSDAPEHRHPPCRGPRGLWEHTTPPDVADHRWPRSR